MGPFALLFKFLWPIIDEGLLKDKTKDANWKKLFGALFLMLTILLIFTDARQLSNWIKIDDKKDAASEERLNTSVNDLIMWRYMEQRWVEWELSQQQLIQTLDRQQQIIEQQRDINRFLAEELSRIQTELIPGGHYGRRVPIEPDVGLIMEPDVPPRPELPLPPPPPPPMDPMSDPLMRRYLDLINQRR